MTAEKGGGGSWLSVQDWNVVATSPRAADLYILAIIYCIIPHRQLVILLSEPLTRRLITLNHKRDVIIFHDCGSGAAMMKS